MMNVLFSYTTTTRNATVTTSYWCTWVHACRMAEELLLYTVGNDNIVATWYEEGTGAKVLRREFYLGKHFLTDEPMVYVKDTEY